MTRRGRSIDMVALAYRALHEGEGFDALLEQWQTRLEAMSAGDVELRGAGGAQMTELRSLIERVPPTAGISGVFHAIANASGPAMVLTPELSVVAANEAGQRQFDATLGARPTFDWLDPDGSSILHSIAARARNGEFCDGAIVRTFVDGADGLAEVFQVRGEKVSRPLIALRALGFHWSPDIDASLRTAFDLTQSECEIARLIFEFADPAAVARERGTAIRTVRTQLSQIFLKTGCAGQVDLCVCLLPCARASAIVQWAAG